MASASPPWPPIAKLRDLGLVVDIDDEAVAEMKRLHLLPQVMAEVERMRAVMPADQVDAMKAAGPAPCDDTPQMRALNYLVGELTKRPKLSGMKITKPGFSLDLNGGR
jgi:hypothetical protein